MGLQSNINQTISIAGYLFSQSPMAERGREKARQDVIQERAEEERGLAAAKTEQDWQALYKHALEGDNKADPTAAGQKAEQEIFANVAQVARKRYLANPTDETYQDYMDMRTGEIEARESMITKQQKAEKERERKQKAEQDRIAFSNMITKGLNQTFEPKTPSLTPEEKAAIFKKNAGGNQ